MAINRSSITTNGLIRSGLTLDGITASLDGDESFSPANYADPYLWLDAQQADSLSLSTAAVESWTDQTSSIVFAKDGDADEARPTYGEESINSLPGLDFDGTADALVAGNTAADWTFLTSSANSGFIVYKVDAYNTTQRLIATRSGANSVGFALLAFSDTDNLNIALTWKFGGSTPAQLFNTGDIPALDQAVVVGWRYDPTLGDDVKLTLWYAGEVNSAVDPTSTFEDNPVDALTVGSAASGTAGTFFNGQIGEVVMWKSALSNAEMAEVNTKLNTKWGIS